MSNRITRPAMCLALATTVIGLAHAQEPAGSPALAAPDGRELWAAEPAPPLPPLEREDDPRLAAGRVLRVELAELDALLTAAPLEFTPAAAEPLVVALPAPGGGFERFALVESPVMAPELAAEFPDIRTYAGRGVDDPHAGIRADVTMHGFHAQVLTPRGRWYIDALHGDPERGVVYRVRDLPRSNRDWSCGFADDDGLRDDGPVLPAGLPSGNELRTYRLAVSATGEYTTYHGGTVEGGQAAIVTAVNRVTGIYEAEFAVRLELVSGNSALVFTDAGADPFTDSNPSAMLSQNQSTCDSVIGNANYDVGHVFGVSGGGGVANLGVVCNNSSKGRGVTTGSPPVGDAFTVDFVSHELGHQFGGSHTFNGTGGSCSGNRSASSAYEPGSGTTIMAYSGICAADNVIFNSSDYFHGRSYDQIRALVTSRTCHDAGPTGNNAPTVNAGPDYTIPARTPFFLTAASGGDPDGDPITYCWEEFDLGPAVSLTMPDNGSSPLFRSRPGQTSPMRRFPPLVNVLAGTTTPKGEKLPVLARTMNFRCTVRDNRLGGGGVNSDTMQVTVVEAAGPFALTFPNTGMTLSGDVNVTWDVAATNVAPINAATVDLLLSIDNGQTFDVVLAAGTPNDGAELVSLPGNLPTTQGRILIQPVGHIFYDINDAAFTLEQACPGDADGDLDVDLDDLLAVLGNFGQAAGSPEEGDMDGDGTVGLDDLLTVLGAFGVTC